METGRKILLNDEETINSITTTSLPVVNLTEECHHTPGKYDELENVINEDYGAKLRSHLYYNNDYRFVYCLIEKVGCSFFKRFLYFFRRGEKTYQLNNPFDLSLTQAHSVHLDDFRKVSSFDAMMMLQSYKKILFVRDPYSRLFSGYVDKVFSRYNVWRGYNKRILIKIGRYSTQRACANDVTFAEFVQFFVKSMRSEGRVNGHFLPMHQHCKPCTVKYDFIGKLEHFNRDIGNMMHLTGLSNYTHLLRGAKEEGVKDELEDVTGILFKTRKNPKSLDECFDTYNAAIRQWRKLQIKGLLSLTLKFPYSESDWKTMDRIRFHNLLLAVHQFSKSIDDYLHENRRKAMMEAYLTLSQETRENLKKILEPDCKLFGYDVNPPFIAGNQTINKPQFFDFNVL